MPKFQPRSYSEKTAREIDEAVRTLIENAFGAATEILQKNHQLLIETAELLLRKETLTAEELPQPIWEEKIEKVQPN